VWMSLNSVNLTFNYVLNRKCRALIDNGGQLAPATSRLPVVDALEVKYASITFKARYRRRRSGPPRSRDQAEFCEQR
jgi:hypothetical protein